MPLPISAGLMSVVPSKKFLKFSELVAIKLSTLPLAMITSGVFSTNSCAATFNSSPVLESATSELSSIASLKFKPADSSNRVSICSAAASSCLILCSRNGAPTVSACFAKSSKLFCALSTAETNLGPPCCSTYS